MAAFSVGIYRGDRGNIATVVMVRDTFYYTIGHSPRRYMLVGMRATSTQ
jgi:hypothetical protein